MNQLQLEVGLGEVQLGVDLSDGISWVLVRQNEDDHTDDASAGGDDEDDHYDHDDDDEDDKDDVDDADDADDADDDAVDDGDHIDINYKHDAYADNDD